MPQNDKNQQFVSRGGIKLQAALDKFQVNVADKVALDVGSSTGGFVDCLLQNGAKKVYALDTAYGELAWKLRNDPRVVVMERTNILYLDHLPGVSLEFARSERFDKKAHLEGGRKDSFQVQSGNVDLITIDAGWTKLELVLPVVKKFLKPDGIIIALLKPHYEAEKKDLIKGVLPAEKAEKIKNKVIEKIVNFQLSIVNCIKSPILGRAGNREYLLFLKS